MWQLEVASNSRFQTTVPVQLSRSGLFGDPAMQLGVHEQEWSQNQSHAPSRTYQQRLVSVIDIECPGAQESDQTGF